MRRTILIVDDEESLRDVLRENLASDYDVVEAGNGYYGLSEVMVGSRQIDLVIADLNMPELNGIELIENLPRGTPVIIISGYLHLPKFGDAVSRLKPVAVLAKPFELSELRVAIDQALGQ